MTTLTGEQFAKLPEQRGWAQVRTSGSHHIHVRAGEAARISLSIHAGSALKLGLQRHLMTLAGITESEL